MANEVTRGDVLAAILEHVNPERVSRHPSDGIVMAGVGQAADAILVLFAAHRDAEVEALRGRFTAPVVCLCGSVRFRSTWAAQMARLTDDGKIVLTVGRMLPKATGEFDPAHKERLDWLHKRKIDLSDSVLVLDVGGYIGDSTRSEIAYAESIGRPVVYLSREFPDFVEPEDEITTLRDQVRALTEENARLEMARHADRDEFGRLEMALRARAETAERELGKARVNLRAADAVMLAIDRAVIARQLATRTPITDARENYSAPFTYLTQAKVSSDG